jgi:hypothetical protein
MKDGRQVTRAVAKLVGEAFVPNPRAEFYTTPIHLNGDVSDCRSENLAWRPRWFAMKFTSQFKSPYPQSRPIRNKKTGEVFQDLWELVIRDGLLYLDVYIATANLTYVWPTMESFEWVE